MIRIYIVGREILKRKFWSARRGRESGNFRKEDLNFDVTFRTLGLLGVFGCLGGFLVIWLSVSGFIFTFSFSFLFVIQ